MNDLSWFDNPRNSVGALATRLASDPTQVQGVSANNASKHFQINPSTVNPFSLLLQSPTRPQERASVMTQTLANLGTRIIIAFIYSWELTLLLVWVPIFLISTSAELKILIRYAAEGKKELERAGMAVTTSSTTLDPVQITVFLVKSEADVT